MQLAARLKARGIDTIFVAGNLAQQPATDGWATVYVAEKTAAGLVQALKQASAGASPCALLLHVAGYGYAKRGAPFWLLQGLRQWRAQNETQRAAGIFHELYASGPVTTSSFWIGPLQKFVARSLWTALDAALTTTPSYAADLSRWRPDAGSSIVEMPVPSNVGEPEHIPGIGARAKRAAVFGRAGTEAALYGQFLKDVEGTLLGLGIEEVIDIGVRHTPPPPAIGGIPVRPLGRLAAERVSEEFLNSRVGLLAYDCARLGKSGVHSGYAAHGVVPVCFDTTVNRPADAIRTAYFRPGRSSPDLDELQMLQNRVVEGYQRHNLDALATSIVSMITAEVKGGP
jgi:hypothetical protein